MDLRATARSAARRDFTKATGEKPTDWSGAILDRMADAVHDAVLGYLVDAANRDQARRSDTRCADKPEGPR